MLRPANARAYDRSRHNLDRHPTYTMAANLRRSSIEVPSPQQG